MNLFEETHSSKKLLVSKKAEDGNWEYKMVELIVDILSSVTVVSTKTLLNFKLDFKINHPQ